MSIYSTRARGIWVDGGDEIQPAELVGYDYLIAKVGTKFHNNVQHAYEANIPLIMFYQFRPEIWEGSTLNYSSWPADQNLCISECRSWIMSGGSKRAIHGLMLDCSEPNPRNKTDVFWLTMPSKKFIDDLWAEFKMPNYLYFNRNPLVLYGGTQTGKDTLYGFVASQDGMSTPTWVNVTAENIPADGTKPLMDYNNSKTWFWLYKVAGARLLSVYLQGTKSGLYNELGFVPNEVAPPVDPVIPPVDPSDPPVAPPVSGDFTEIASYLNQIWLEAQKQTAELKKISKHFAP
jgi:hypothetical protein